MGSIGVAELVVIALILLVLAVPVVVVVVIVSRARRGGEGLVPCRACGRPISPRASACPACGDPRGIS